MKVAAARELTLATVLRTARERKGLDMVAVVDCACPGVREELGQLERKGELIPVRGGGYLTPAGLGFVPAAEFELGRGPGAGTHVLLYLPDLESLDEVAGWVAERVSNPELSTQRVAAEAGDLARLAAELGGLVVCAHAFTPYKGYLGRERTPPLSDTFPACPFAVELGLSADSDLADRLPELAGYPYLSSSDAHAAEAVAREYVELELLAPSFAELLMALETPPRHGRRILANYGLDPRLGKYHRSHCRRCGFTADTEPPPVLSCPRCGDRRLVVGVLDRVVERSSGRETLHPPWRPRYVAQIPLADMPGIGPKTRRALLAAFGTEMTVLHRAAPADLAAVVGEELARRIIGARQGKLGIRPGGGGRPGRVRR